MCSLWRAINFIEVLDIKRLIVFERSFKVKNDTQNDTQNTHLIFPFFLGIFAS